MPDTDASFDLTIEITERDPDPVREREAYEQLRDQHIRQNLRSFAAELRGKAEQIRMEILLSNQILYGNYDRYSAALIAYQRGAEVAENAAAADNPRSYLEACLREDREDRERREQQRARREANANRWFSVALGLGLGSLPILIPVIIDLFSRRADDQPTADIQFFPEDLSKDQETKKMLAEHHDAWLQQSEQSYWQDTMAPIAMAEIPTTGQRPTLGDHLFYLNFTKAISSLDAPFVWDTGDDYMAMVNNLVCEFDVKAPTHIADLYLKLPALTYHDQPLPRLIAADVMQSALAMIAKSLGELP